MKFSFFENIIFSKKEKEHFRECEAKEKEIGERLRQNPTTSVVLSFVDDPTYDSYISAEQVLDIVLRELHALQLKVALLQLPQDNKPKIKKPRAKKKKGKKNETSTRRRSRK